MQQLAKYACKLVNVVKTTTKNPAAIATPFLNNDFVIGEATETDTKFLKMF